MMFHSNTLPHQVAAFICRQIVHAERLPGSALPDVRELAIQLEVSSGHVGKAIMLLLNNKILHTENGLTQISPDAPKLAIAWLRDDFTRNQLPHLAAQLQLLKMTPADLQLLLQQNPLHNKHEIK